MGNRNTKSSLRNAIIHLSISAGSVGLDDETFWSQILNEDAHTASDIIKVISVQEVRMLRDGSPKNFASLAYKMAEHLCLATKTLCNTYSQQTAVINAAKILTRILPCIFEDKEWCDFFEINVLETNESGQIKKKDLVFRDKINSERDYTQYLPFQYIKPNNSLKEVNSAYRSSNASKNETSSFSSEESKVKKSIVNDNEANSIKFSSNLMLSICDLLFCPEFTVNPHSEKYLNRIVDAPPEDIRSLSTCDYVWEPGVGFDSYINSTTSYDKNRSELLRLLLVCLSSILYARPEKSNIAKNPWLETFTSSQNRHALPIFTSLLNTVFIYKPAKILPFNYLLFEDNREELVELCIQVLICTLDNHLNDEQDASNIGRRNMFNEYTSRIHRGEDFSFVVKGFARLFNSRFDQGSLINSTKQISFEQELLILFWRFCNLNFRFINYIMTSKEILDVTVPILFHLNENFRNSTKSTLIYTGIFNLLIMSSERNFGVMLNRPYSSNYLTNIPSFTGSHADLVIIVFHKLILYGQNFEQLIDFLMTIIVNISPYLKTITVLASRCLIQLFEIFTSPYVIFTEPNYHGVIIYLLEIFNNLIQYQFDGNANLVYIILDKKDAFLDLANLTCSTQGIQRVFRKLIKKKKRCQVIKKPDVDCLNSNNSSTCGNVEGLEPPKEVKQTSSYLLPQLEVALPAIPSVSSITQTIHPSDKKILKNVEENEAEVSNFILGDDLNQRLETTIMKQNSSQTITTTPSIPEQQVSLIDDNPFIFENSLATDCQINSDIDLESSICFMKPCESKQMKWRPTPEWVKEWKISLPLHTILRMVEVLEPQVERIKQSCSNEAEIISFLRNGTLVGLLPVPHPIQIRKYRINDEIILWFRCCAWGVIYGRSTIWINTLVSLLKIV